MFSCNGLTFSPIWHCFGNYMHRASLETIQQLLDESGSNVLPINTHRLDAGAGRGMLQIGFAGVTYDELREERPGVEGMIKMLNINHQISADEAVARARRAVEITGERILKLEVLTHDLRHSCDEALVEAVWQLTAWDPSLMILPLHSSHLDTALTLVDMGCPVLRVMGSPIGSMAGILDPAAVEHICERTGVPVVLDGGIDSADTAEKAFSMGVRGVLVNSMLFGQDAPPPMVMREFRQRLEPILAGQGR